MINEFLKFVRTHPVAGATLSLVVASTSAQSGQSAPSLLESVPAQWQQLVATACSAHPVNRGASAEVYFSDYVGYRKLLLLGADGLYHLIYWDENDQTGRIYAGPAKRNRERITLDMKPNTQSLGSDTNDALLVPMRIGAQRFLLQEQSLDEIGATIQWHGLLGESRNYFMEARCDKTPPTLALDGPKAPPWSDLPNALKRFAFAHPVEARIIALIEDSSVYDYVERDGEFRVRVDKGSNDMFRINMPLCSPRSAGQQWKGWVGDPLADSSEVRIVIHEREHGEQLVFPAVGQVLSTSAGECEEVDSD